MPIKVAEKPFAAGVLHPVIAKNTATETRKLAKSPSRLIKRNWVCINNSSGSSVSLLPAIKRERIIKDKVNKPVITLNSGLAQEQINVAISPAPANQFTASLSQPT